MAELEIEPKSLDPTKPQFLLLEECLFDHMPIPSLYTLVFRCQRQVEDLF